MTTWNASTAKQYGELGEQSHLPILADAILDVTPIRDRRVLDFGCGDGRLLARLMEREPPKQVRAIDVSEDLLRVARKAIGELPGELLPRVTFKHGDERMLPTDQKFDVALCSLMLMMLDHRDRLLAACRGMLQSIPTSGSLVITLTHPCFRREKHATFHNELPEDFNYWQSGRAYNVVIDPEEKQVQATLSDYHWTLTDYAEAIAEAGGVVTRLRELPGQYDAEGQPMGRPAYLLLEVRRPAR